ncbi:hypothetical protein CcI49_35265 [Frankia sp. CcI49]|uniref:TetR/AcrR family transcriptional regulator n=1 Tax=unclassified Frankia TaxID=2632575 RepID=UPI0006CA54B0|nr:MULTISPECIES: TetR/AcrR family transcriptional regulator [unclassified Frankia]KPM52160.1 hypothetical protein ACG83_32210 [Frankia sp. R43]ONH51667.1 hypothetical protein CcI49_35265 [Frankia sp. CcI49]
MPRDGDATRRSILQSARTEFAAFGLAGARVDRIAARAGCNKERIYASFGDKQQLHRRVLAEMLEEMRTATIVEVDEDVASYIHKSYEFQRRNPALLRMLLWEALECTAESPLPDEQGRRDCYALSTRALKPHTEGSDEENARWLLLTLIGLSAWPHAVPTLARLVTDDASATDEGQEKLREFLATFAAGGAAATAAMPPGHTSGGRQDDGA